MSEAAVPESVTIAAVPERVGLARAFVAAVLGESHPCRDVAVLLASELVTNSVRHSGSAVPGGLVTVAVAVGGEDVRVDVTDRSGDDAPVLPPAAFADGDAEGRRGLGLVDACAARWGYWRGGGFTTTWFELCDLLQLIQHSVGSDRSRDLRVWHSEYPAVDRAFGHSVGASRSVAWVPRGTAAGGAVAVMIAASPFTLWERTLGLGGMARRGSYLVSGLVISVTALPAGDGVCSVVRLAGEADVTCGELRDALASAVAARPRVIAVDMSSLTFIDSGALQMVVAAYRVIRAEGGTLVLVSPSGAVARVLELTGVSAMMTVCGSAEEAVGRFAAG
jgi:anti-anti-sigma factor